MGTEIGKRIGLEWVEEFYPVKGSSRLGSVRKVGKAPSADW